jgi:hypothetical protein
MLRVLDNSRKKAQKVQKKDAENLREGHGDPKREDLRLTTLAIH